jgi:hypothetical protein
MNITYLPPPDMMYMIHIRVPEDSKKIPDYYIDMAKQIVEQNKLMRLMGENDASL